MIPHTSGTKYLIHQLRWKSTSAMTHSISAALMWTVYSQHLWVRAWPWQRATLASFPRLLPFLQPHVMGGIFGMLLMSVLEGIPSCWILSPVSFKTPHQKMRRMEMSHAAVPQSSEPQLKHHVDRFKTGYEIWAGLGLCLLQMAEYLRAAVAESADKQMKQLKSRIHPAPISSHLGLNVKHFIFKNYTYYIYNIFKRWNCSPHHWL